MRGLCGLCVGMFCLLARCSIDKVHETFGHDDVFWSLAV